MDFNHYDSAHDLRFELDRGVDPLDAIARHLKAAYDRGLVDGAVAALLPVEGAVSFCRSTASAAGRIESLAGAGPESISVLYHGVKSGIRLE